MAIFRKIHTSFWSDAFVQTLTPEQKFFFLYLLTNERTRQCGIYEITIRQISFDTGYTVETVLRLIEWFVNSGKIMFSRETSEIAVKNWQKYNSSDSPSVKNLVNKELMSVKDKKLIEWVHSVDTVYTHNKTYTGGEPEEEEEQEREIEVEVAPEEIPEIGSEKVSEIANEVWKDQRWREDMCIGLSLTQQELIKWLALFNSSISTHKDKKFNKSAYKRMSRGWIMSQKAKGNDIINQQQQKITPSAPPLKTITHGI